MEGLNDPEEKPARGGEWEVVSLTESAYAASPSLEKHENAEVKNGHSAREEGDTDASSAMLLSDHFVFPPSQHENLPLDSAGRPMKIVGPDDGAQIGEVEESEGHLKGQVSYKKEAAGCAELEHISSDQEKSTYRTQPTSLEPETGKTGSTEHTENPNVTKSESSSEPVVHSPHDDDDDDGDQIPSKKDLVPPQKGRWRFYVNVKEAGPLCTLFIVVAVLGLVIMGRRWHKERLQKCGRMCGPITRLKNVIAGGHRSCSN